VVEGQEFSQRLQERLEGLTRENDDLREERATRNGAGLVSETKT
jgi:hypothetical protein